MEIQQSDFTDTTPSMYYRLGEHVYNCSNKNFKKAHKIFTKYFPIQPCELPIIMGELGHCMTKNQALNIRNSLELEAEL